MTWGMQSEVKREWVSRHLQLSRVEEEAKDTSVMRSGLYPQGVVTSLKLYHSAELLSQRKLTCMLLIHKKPKAWRNRGAGNTVPKKQREISVTQKGTLMTQGL